MLSVFRLPLLMLKSRRPSRVKDMPTVVDGLWLRRGYEALTFFGTIVAATDAVAADMGRQWSCLKNHEMIHLYQARNTHDSWLCFYLLYLWYYVRALPMNRRMRNAAYLLNPFEMEAYEHMDERDYLQRDECGAQWRLFARMTPQERMHHQAVVRNQGTDTK